MAGRKPKFDDAMSDAERQALRIALSSDLAKSMPECADPGRREKYKSDLLGFGYWYFSKWCTRNPSGPIIDYTNDLTGICFDGGLQAQGMARGFGKTTWAKIAVMWSVLYGHVDFVVFLADGQPNAESGLAEIRSELSSNQKLRADFPEACYPFRALRGKSQRCASQNFAGEPTNIMLSPDELRLAVIPGSVSSGSIIVARGILTGFQGLLRDGRRPKLIIGDDLQSKIDARYPKDTETRLDILRGGVLGLGGHNDKLGVLILCTCNQTGDMADQLMDPEVSPEWQGARYGLMKAWPRNSERWSVYKSLALSDIRAKRKSLPTATAYYLENQSDMDDGGVATDPELYNTRLELSAIQHAWNLRIRMREKAYWAEEENKPILATGTLYEITPTLIASRINHISRWAAPSGSSMCVASCDINDDKMRWAVIAIAGNQTETVVDRGEYPEGDRNLIPAKCQELKKKSLIWMGMLAVLKTMMALHIIDTNGRHVPMRALGFDAAGEIADLVYSFCAQASAPFAVTAVRGFSFKHYSSNGKHVIGEPGYYCHMAKTEKGVFLAFHADFWREFVQRSFLPSALSPGSTSLWGDNPDDHIDFGNHICAEKLAGKTMMSTRSGQVTVWMWHLRPDRNNHLLDVMGACNALASWFRAFRLTPESVDAAISDDRPDKKTEASQVAFYPRISTGKHHSAKRRIVRVPGGRQ